jgi:hypothetical protein
MKYYTQDEKKQQLFEFIKSCECYVHELQKIPALHEETAYYESVIRKSEKLYYSDFTQQELSELARSVSVIYSCHPHWQTPILKTEDKEEFSIPEWFNKLYEIEENINKNKKDLITVGYY